MLSIERVRGLIKNPTLTDREVTEIRNTLDALAELIFEQWQEEMKINNKKHE